MRGGASVAPFLPSRLASISEISKFHEQSIQKLDGEDRMLVVASMMVVVAEQGVAIDASASCSWQASHNRRGLPRRSANRIACCCMPERTHLSSQLEYAVCVVLICMFNLLTSTVRQCQQRFSPTTTTSISPINQQRIATQFQQIWCAISRFSRLQTRQ